MRFKQCNRHGWHGCAFQLLLKGCALSETFADVAIRAFSYKVTRLLAAQHAWSPCCMQSAALIGISSWGVGRVNQRLVDSIAICSCKSIFQGQGSQGLDSPFPEAEAAPA